MSSFDNSSGSSDSASRSLPLSTMEFELAPASVLTVGPPSSVTTTCTSAASIAILTSMFFALSVGQRNRRRDKRREALEAGLIT